MGKRTLRIQQKDIASRGSEIVGKTVQIVLLNGITHAGLLLQCDNEHLTIQDANAGWTHKKKHQHRVSFSEIQYIVLEIISAW